MNIVDSLKDKVAELANKSVDYNIEKVDKTLCNCQGSIKVRVVAIDFIHEKCRATNVY